MKIIADNSDHMALVLLGGAEYCAVEFMPENYVSQDVHGRIVGLDLMDTRPFGEPFDEAAARRALGAAQDMLGGRPDVAPQ